MGGRATLAPPGHAPYQTFHPNSATLEQREKRVLNLHVYAVHERAKHRWDVQRHETSSRFET